MQRYRARYLNSRLSIDRPRKFRHFYELAFWIACNSRQATQDWSPRSPIAFRRLESLALTEPGLRGVQKAREPGNRPNGPPALRMPLALLMQPRVAYHLENKSRKEIAVAVVPTSDNSPRPSSARTGARWWCAWCGSDIPASVGRRPSHCSPACVDADLADARKTRDRERASALYTLRALVRRRSGASA